jgi:hypothetical protein
MSIVEKLYWTKGVDHGRELERERIIKILDENTGHNGKTHYEGIDCHWCNVNALIREDK